jgi:hypothetical protein
LATSQKAGMARETQNTADYNNIDILSVVPYYLQ